MNSIAWNSSARSPATTPGGGLFARLTGAFGRRGLHSQLALITGNMDQMQSGVNFVDFKAQGQDGKSAAR